MPIFHWRYGTLSCRWNKNQPWSLIFYGAVLCHLFFLWWQCWLQIFSFWPCCASNLTVVMIHIGVVLSLHCVISMVCQSSCWNNLRMQSALMLFAVFYTSCEQYTGLNFAQSSVIHHHPSIIHFTLTIQTTKKQNIHILSFCFFCRLTSKKTVNCDRHHVMLGGDC